MAYELKAVIATKELLRASTASLSGGLVLLVQGFAMLPLTDAVVKTLASPVTDERLPGLQTLPAGLHRALADWSANGPVAYVHCESHAGVIFQETAVWEAGRAIAALQTGPSCSWPISEALRRIGVSGGCDGWDEFDVLGLGRHRRTER